MSLNPSYTPGSLRKLNILGTEELHRRTVKGQMLRTGRELSVEMPLCVDVSTALVDDPHASRHAFVLRKHWWLRISQAFPFKPRENQIQSYCPPRSEYFISPSYQVMLNKVSQRARLTGSTFPFYFFSFFFFLIFFCLKIEIECLYFDRKCVRCAGAIHSQSLWLTVFSIMT